MGIKRSKETKRKQSIATSGKNNSVFGKKWIHNKFLNEHKLIPKSEFEKYLINGWEIGMLKTKNNAL